METNWVCRRKKKKKRTGNAVAVDCLCARPKTVCIYVRLMGSGMEIVTLTLNAVRCQSIERTARGACFLVFNHRTASLRLRTKGNLGNALIVVPLFLASFADKDLDWLNRRKTWNFVTKYSNADAGRTKSSRNALILSTLALMLITKPMFRLFSDKFMAF